MACLRVQTYSIKLLLSISCIMKSAIVLITKSYTGINYINKFNIYIILCTKIGLSLIRRDVTRFITIQYVMILFILYLLRYNNLNNRISNTVMFLMFLSSLNIIFVRATLQCS